MGFSFVTVFRRFAFSIQFKGAAFVKKSLAVMEII